MIVFSSGMNRTFFLIVLLVPVYLELVVFGPVIIGLFCKPFPKSRIIWDHLGACIQLRLVWNPLFFLVPSIGFYGSTLLIFSHSWFFWYTLHWDCFESSPMCESFLVCSFGVLSVASFLKSFSVLVFLLSLELSMCLFLVSTYLTLFQLQLLFVYFQLGLCFWCLFSGPAYLVFFQTVVFNLPYLRFFSCACF